MASKYLGHNLITLDKYFPKSFNLFTHQHKPCFPVFPHELSSVCSIIVSQDLTIDVPCVWFLALYVSFWHEPIDLEGYLSAPAQQIFQAHLNVSFKSWFSPFTVWAPGIPLMPSALASGALPTKPSC